MSNKIVEIFGQNTNSNSEALASSIRTQYCPFLNKKCIKIRKSNPNISIGTCTVKYNTDQNLIICPHRLLEKQKIFLDCLHLLTLHEPGNDLYILPEITIPGGSVDFFLVSAKHNKIKDFVGIELQTLDTTGTVWPERQRLLSRIGMDTNIDDTSSTKSYGINWKMTAKTILIQMRHKSETFEHINKHLVLIIQSPFFKYMLSEFSFGNMPVARLGDPVHIHTYDLNSLEDDRISLSLAERFSTDSEGIAKSLGLHAETKIDLRAIEILLESKLDDKFRLSLNQL